MSFYFRNFAARWCVLCIDQEMVEAQKSDFRAYGVKGVRMRNLFEEPRKFTLRGQLKAAFSGSTRALVV